MSETAVTAEDRQFVADLLDELLPKANLRDHPGVDGFVIASPRVTARVKSFGRWGPAELIVFSQLIRVTTHSRLRAGVAHELGHLQQKEERVEFETGAEEECDADRRAVEICGDAPGMACLLLDIVQATGRTQHSTAGVTMEERVHRLAQMMLE